MNSRDMNNIYCVVNSIFGPTRENVGSLLLTATHKTMVSSNKKVQGLAVNLVMEKFPFTEEIESEMESLCFRIEINPYIMSTAYSNFTETRN